MQNRTLTHIHILSKWLFHILPHTAYKKRNDPTKYTTTTTTKREKWKSHWQFTAIDQGTPNKHITQQLYTIRYGEWYVAFVEFICGNRDYIGHRWHPSVRCEWPNWEATMVRNNAGCRHGLQSPFGCGQRGLLLSVCAARRIAICQLSGECDGVRVYVLCVLFVLTVLIN